MRHRKDFAYAPRAATSETYGHRGLKDGSDNMIRILVANDSEVVRRGIRQLLRQRKDWEVCGEAVDGQDAVAKARQLDPDVVVLDIAMPVMNGIDAAKQIRKERPNTAIVLCSMYFDTQLASIARDVGIMALLSKSNVGQVVKGVEVGLRGESITESII
jgi:DNA-binding NarL/FixJ family response regulator